MYILERYPWPGNIRELRNVIERATILAEGEFIEPRHLPPTLISRGEEVAAHADHCRPARRSTKPSGA